MRTGIVIGKIKDYQQQAAVQLLVSPNGKEGFDYGAACGIMKGLELALQIIEKDQEEVNKQEAGTNG